MSAVPAEIPPSRGPKGKPVALARDTIVPTIRLRGCRWEVPDHIAEQLHEVRVMTLSVVLRFEHVLTYDSRAPAWETSLMEIMELTD